MKIVYRYCARVCCIDPVFSSRYSTLVYCPFHISLVIIDPYSNAENFSAFLFLMIWDFVTHGVTIFSRECHNLIRLNKILVSAKISAS